MTPTDPKSTPLLWIALFKLAKAALLLTVALGIHHLLSAGIEPTALHWAHAARVDPDDRLVRTLLQRLTHLTDPQIRALSLGTFLYGLLFATEGIGLLLRRHWAEYLTAASTALLLPLELYEVLHRPTLARTVILIANILIVAYLIHRLRRERGERPQSPPAPVASSPLQT